MLLNMNMKEKSEKLLLLDTIAQTAHSIAGREFQEKEHALQNQTSGCGGKITFLADKSAKALSPSPAQAFNRAKILFFFHIFKY